MTPVIDVRHLYKRYGDTVAVDDVLVQRAARRDLRDPRPERRGQDHHGGVRRGPARSRPGNDQRARPGPAPGPGRADPAGRRAAAGQPAAGPAAGGRGARAQQRVLPDPGRLAVPAGGARARGQGPDAVRQAVRRAEAAAVHRARAGRQPAGGGARRAHHWPGPAGPAGHLGADRGRARPRCHDRARHPLHGRGRAAVRPGCADRHGPGGRRSTRRPRWPNGSKPSSGSSSARAFRSTTGCSAACPT